MTHAATRPVWTSSLLRWFTLNRRDMPWRSAATPYRIWISEIMLQQTQVAAATPFFKKFVRRFPSVKVLANAKLHDVLKTWEGLGYYTRARNLHRAAKLIVQQYDAQLPTSALELETIPGIGRYTAAAIASIAFGEVIPAIDGNVVRVFTRFMGITADSTTPRTRKRIETFLTKHISKKRPGDFNQAAMELGATLCRPRRPMCSKCPLRRCCRAFTQNKTHSIPARPKPKKVPHYHVAACVIRKGHRVLISQRRHDQMLGGLWEFPGGKKHRNETIEAAAVRELQEEAGIQIRVLNEIQIIKHAYSHFRITLHALDCVHVRGRARAIESDAVRWVSIKDLPQYAFPSADRQIIETLLREDSS